ncbi:MAG: hypothetical protein LUD71_01355 [Clostridiales bacterium]|nr:hypothetical protein [Clostridiales bacterium]MCD8324016.1 hypothetical protein [Clostridiales bacterium]MCD8333650.1 hypothetical protein [Clostridiales bacterium]
MTDLTNCTHDCSTCGASCAPDGERKPSFFDRMEAASEHFEAMGEENFINMLNEAVAALEKEDAED